MARSDKHKKDWIEAYNSAQRNEALMPPGTGWRKFVELKSDLKLGSCKLRELIKTLQEEEKIEVYVGSEPDITGVLKKRVWYRIK